MTVLIVESDPDLAEIWRRHLIRQGLNVAVANDEAAAVDHLDRQPCEVIVLNLVLTEGSSALAVADYASFRQPDARIIFVTDTSFFSDGSIFGHVGNAAFLLRSDAPVADLAALVEHYGEKAVRDQ